MRQDTWNLFVSTETMKSEWKMYLGWVWSLYTYILTTATLGRTNHVNLKQMRWNGLPWSEETWHCYSRNDRRWRSTHGYGWEMTESSLRWFTWFFILQSWWNCSHKDHNVTGDVCKVKSVIPLYKNQVVRQNLLHKTAVLVVLRVGYLKAA